MTSLVQIERADGALIARVSAAMAEAARRSGAWLACRPGCTPCCHGPFAITRLDELRLRRGLAEAGAEVRARIQQRARAAIARMEAMGYPGDPATGELFDEDALPAELDDAPCPVLDPETGHCDLYEWRPLTCRTFGPAAQMGDGSYGACELCYHGAAEEEIAACAVDPDPEGAEPALLAELADEHGRRGMTLVAYALR